MREGKSAVFCLGFAEAGSSLATLLPTLRLHPPCYHPPRSDGGCPAKPHRATRKFQDFPGLRVGTGGILRAWLFWVWKPCNTASEKTSHSVDRC